MGVFSIDKKNPSIRDKLQTENQAGKNEKCDL